MKALFAALLSIALACDPQPLTTDLVGSIAKRTELASTSLVTLRESWALGIGGQSAGRFVTGTMEYLAAARSRMALRDGRIVKEAQDPRVARRNS